MAIKRKVDKEKEEPMVASVTTGEVLIETADDSAEKVQDNQVNLGQATASGEKQEQSPVRVQVEVESEADQSNLPSQSVEPEVQAQPPTKDFTPAGMGVEYSASGGGGWKKWLTMLVVLVIAGGLLVGGVMVYQKAVGSSKGGPTPTPRAEALPTGTPVASPGASLSRGDVNLQVLNGTTTVGYAAKAKAYLQGLGWTNVAVGNADTTDFSQTEVAIKDDKKSYLDMLIKDLGVKYTVDSNTKALDAGSKYDAVITLGTGVAQ